MRARPAARLLRFATVGGLMAAANLAGMWLLVDRLGVHYLVALAALFLAGSTVAWLANRRFTFRSSVDRPPEAGRYLALSLLGLLAGMGLMALCVDGIGIPPVPATVLVAGGMTLVNYLGHARWTFRAAG